MRLPNFPPTYLEPSAIYYLGPSFSSFLSSVPLITHLYIWYKNFYASLVSPFGDNKQPWNRNGENNFTRCRAWHMVLFLSLAENCWPLHIVYLLFYLRFIFNFFSPFFLSTKFSLSTVAIPSLFLFFSGRLNFFFFFFFAFRIENALRGCCPTDIVSWSTIDSRCSVIPAFFCVR